MANSHIGGYMDIKRKRTAAAIVIVIAVLLILAVIANFISTFFSMTSSLIMVTITFCSIYAIILALSAFNATEEESAKEFQNRIKDFENRGYVVNSSRVEVVPYLNTRDISAKNFWGSLQVVGKEKFDDFKITIFRDHFFISQAAVETSRSVSVIRYKEYVVVYDEQNEKAVWLVK